MNEIDALYRRFVKANVEAESLRRRAVAVDDVECECVEFGVMWVRDLWWVEEKIMMFECGICEFMEVFEM